MPNIGPLELAIVVIIALVIFGPKRLPELGKSLGDGMREFKSSISGDNKDDELHEIENGVEEDDALVDDEEPTPTAVAEADTEAQTQTQSSGAAERQSS
jgi:sec-independent protein translocase protein TatA